MTDLSNIEFNFSETKQAAIEFIQVIKDLQNKEDVLDKIYKSLSYDNTNEIIIYRALEKLYDLELKEEYSNIIKEYRPVISMDQLIKNNGNKLYHIDGIFISRNEEEIKNDFIELLNTLLRLNNGGKIGITKITMKFEKKDGIIYLPENLELFEFKELQTFAIIYKKFRFVKKFYNNQPVEFNTNPILYFNIIINLIFDIILNEKKEVEFNYIKLKDRELKKFLKFEEYIKITLIEKLSNNNFLTKENDLSNKFFIFFMDSKIKSLYNNYHEDFIFKNKEDCCLDKKSLEIFLKNYSGNQKLFLFNNMKVLDDKFEIIDKENNNIKVSFEYSKFDKNIIDKIINQTDLNYIDFIRYKNINLCDFQNENFFSQTEINYMKMLIREIVNSKFFEELADSYSESNYLPKDVLKNKIIQNYIIDTIIFLPYDQKNFEAEGLTFEHNSQIILSGYPYGLPGEYEDLRIFHILELSRKVIEMIHEYIHAIKRYLSISTNGLISCHTLDENGKRDEAGYLFEFLMFGWEHKKYKNLEKICKRKLNDDLKKGKLNVRTSLKILNPDLYSYDVKSVKKILYNNEPLCQEFEKKEMNFKLKQFLIKLGFDNEEKIGKLKEDNSTIFAKRNSSSNNTIIYDFRCGNEKSSI